MATRSPMRQLSFRCLAPLADLVQRLSHTPYCNILTRKLRYLHLRCDMCHRSSSVRQENDLVLTLVRPGVALSLVTMFTSLPCRKTHGVHRHFDSFRHGDSDLCRSLS